MDEIQAIRKKVLKVSNVNKPSGQALMVENPFWSSVNFHPFSLTANGSWVAFGVNG
jgi:hypothetical protein